MQQKYKTKCHVCSKTIECYTGFENWSVLENETIVPLCPECSKLTKEWIDFMRQLHTKDFRCAKCDNKMTKINEHNWECKKCHIHLSVG